MKALSSEDGRLAAAGKFERAASATMAPYIAFSDQDDGWRADKLEWAHCKMCEAKAAHPAGTLVLVHADRRIVDEAGREIASSN